MDIVFLSAGPYHLETEEKFLLLKEKSPSIKRIHGLEDKDQALSLASNIVDDESFLVIDASGNQRSYSKADIKPVKISKPEIKSGPLDILYLTHKELQAEENFTSLLKKWPSLKRLHGVNGLTRAFRRSADMIGSSYFVLIDGDNKVVDDFDFSNVVTPSEPDTLSFYLTRNPVNDLVYGYGGIKVCPTVNFRMITEDKIDPIVSGGIKNIVPVRQVASITEFNTSPFNAWKAGFREGVMLTSPDVEAQMPGNEAKERLNIWQTKGEDRRFGLWAITGARMGEAYAKENFGVLNSLSKINDPKWLEAYILTKTGLEQLDDLSNVDRGFIKRLKV